jgi:hypothetical protein
MLLNASMMTAKTRFITKKAPNMTIKQQYTDASYLIVESIVYIYFCYLVIKIHYKE